MVGKIIVDGHAVDLTDALQAALDPTKLAQRLNRLGHIDTGLVGRRHRGERVHGVVLAEHGPLKAVLAALVGQGEPLTAGLVELHFPGAVVVGRAEPKPLDLAPATLSEHLIQSQVVLVGDHGAVAWDGADQVVELCLNRAQVGINVGVIELEVVQHRHAGAVVNKLRALVKKRRVVFVSLDHKPIGPGAC